MTSTTESDRTSELVHSFQRGKRTQRWQALCALQELGAEAAPALPDLIAALGDADLGFRTHAVLALVGIGAEAVSPLLEALVTQDEDLRKAIVVTLGRIGPAAAPATPTLVGLLEDEALANVARQALERIERCPAAELVPHFRKTFSLAVISCASIVLLVGVVVLLAWSGAVLRPGSLLATAVAAALGFLCGGLGAALGGHSWGRVGTVVGFVCLGAAGYLLGLFMGEFAALLLTPLQHLLTPS